MNINKIIKILSFLLLTILLTSCMQQKQDISDAKKELGIDSIEEEYNGEDEEYEDQSNDIYDQELDNSPENNIVINPAGDENNSIDLSLMPISGEYGNPIELGNGSISYSDLKGLEIKKHEYNQEDEKITEEADENVVEETTKVDELSEVTCENISDYLEKNISGYYWWNTCRDIIKGEGVSVFITKLVDETYTYEKHYILFNKGLYGVYELESEVPANLEDKVGDIQIKNTEFKSKNDSYKILEIVDKLFVEILKK